MKLVLDTNIYISCLAFDSFIESTFNQILLDPQISIHFSKDTFAELLEKLKYSNFQKIIAKSKREITKENVTGFLDYIRQISEFVENPMTKVNICRDPKDNKFLELTKEIKADYLITGDNVLLELKQFENCKIRKPGQFLDQIQS